MCILFWKKKPIDTNPVTGAIKLSRVDFLSELEKVHIAPISWGDPLDSFVWIAPKLELDRIAPSLVYPADYYVNEVWDCEDYGIQGQSDAARLFKTNGIRLCLGDTALGYHGFLVTLDTDFKVWWLEPNAGFSYAGEWFKIGEHSYLPKKVLA